MALSMSSIRFSKPESHSVGRRDADYRNAYELALLRSAAMYLPNFLDGFDRLVAFDAETTGKRTGAPRSFVGRTAIGSAINFAFALFSEAKFATDGLTPSSFASRDARAFAAALSGQQRVWHAFDTPHQGGADLPQDRQSASGPVASRTYEDREHRPLPRDRSR